MKISLTDTEAVNMLSILNERKAKYTKLAGLAEERMKYGRYKNSEMLKNRHNKKVEVAQGLIMKIASQL